jgi:hypothetical protein
MMVTIGLNEPVIIPYQDMNRSRRDEALQRTDWTQANDSPLSESDQLKYRTYRQALRDLTTHENWPELQEEDWPTLEN